MMKKQSFLFFVILLLSLIVSGCSTQGGAKKKVELTVSAAASLTDALNDIKGTFETEYPNIKINYNFGGSGTLQQQISQGAPVDLFISAAKDKFDKLAGEGLIVKDHGIDLIKNQLVMVVPKGSDKGIKSFEDLPQAEKISIGIPESVPAGKYAKETLESLHIWEMVEGKVVYAKDVRQVLTYVETGNVDAGIVYKTDAMISSKVEIVATAEDDTHTLIIYPVGVIKNSSHFDEAQIFYEYLQSETALKTLEEYGFKGMN